MTNKKLYLIGDPVDHSLSPLLHGAMIAQTGVHYTYEVRRQCPAAHLRHMLPQQRAGAPQNTGADTHRAGRVVQLDGELFHRLPPQPVGHCIQQSDSRLAIKSLSIDGNINT